MGLLDEALEVGSNGVKRHPEFAAGRIALARVFIERKLHREALEQLRAATELSPDNLLAFQLLGETHLELRQPKDALAAFKMVLFLNPLHDRAQKMVRKWEFLTADEFENDEFEWTTTEDAANEDRKPQPAPIKENDSDRAAYRAVSVADALTVRNDLENAFAVIGRAIRELGPRSDLKQRLELLGRRLALPVEDVQTILHGAPQAKAEFSPQPSAKKNPNEKKQKRLQGMLKKLEKQKPAGRPRSR